MRAKYSSTCRSSSRRSCVFSFTWIHRTGLLLIGSPRRTKQDGGPSLSDNKGNEEVGASFPVAPRWRSGSVSVVIFYHALALSFLTDSRKRRESQTRQMELALQDTRRYCLSLS